MVAANVQFKHTKRRNVHPLEKPTDQKLHFYTVKMCFFTSNLVDGFGVTLITTITHIHVQLNLCKTAIQT